MAKRLSELSYYELLAVAPDAGQDLIKAAFRAFARRFHPDQERADPVRRERLLQIYRRGTEAYRVLMDPAARRGYDEQLAVGILRYQEGRAPMAERGRRASSQRLSARGRQYLLEAERAADTGDLVRARLLLGLARQQDPECPAVSALGERIARLAGGETS